VSEKILIADDDPDILRFVEVNLTIEGYDVVAAVDGEEALNKAIETLPDLVLLDVMMPKIDGFEVCRMLRADPRTSNLSIIMVTAKSLSADKITGLSNGADDYILKPFDPLELLARVKRTLRRAQDMKDLQPLTGLPGNVPIMEEVQRRIATGTQFALLHIDLDNFKAFNDHYGFMRGDQAIKLMARILSDAAISQGATGLFTGHIGGDDFAAVCEADVAESFAKEIIRRFDEAVPALYDPKDAEKGLISIQDRRGELQDYPIMTISIGIASNSNREIDSHILASEIATELKQLAKRTEGSSLAIDRRGSEDD
jgi:diguanylate cyclase (GGDEF)-like protein